MHLTTLFEVDFYDRSPLTAVLKRHRGKWIHFSKGAPNRSYRDAKLEPEPERPAYYDRAKNKQYQRDLLRVARRNAIQPVPKIGINPRSIWQDPSGVYCYPVDWLLSGHERIMSGNQYGMNFPYYYICEIKLDDPNGVNLGTITWDQIEAIAARNGWLEPLRAFRELPPAEQKAQLFGYARPDLPGSFFWHFIDRMVKDGKMTWTKAYRGVSYVRDPNLSIIHSNEPNQILVLDPRILKVVEMGDNRHPVQAYSSQNEMDQWMHALLTILKTVRGEVGGDLTWKDKRPSLSFRHGQGNFVLTIPVRTGNSMERGLLLNYTYGRAEGSMSISRDDLDKLGIDQIVGKITSKAKTVAGYKSDLLFKPLLSIADGQRVMAEQLVVGSGMRFSVRINNADGGERRWNTVFLHGEMEHEVDRVICQLATGLVLYEDHFSARVSLTAGKHALVYGDTPYNENWTDLATAMPALAEVLAKNFANSARQFDPALKRSSGYNSNPRFSSEAELTAFKGWVASRSGINLQGEFQRQLSDEIAAFDAYPEPRVLLSNISYCLNSKW